LVRLREWGFNAVGPGGDGCGRDDGLPFFANVDFCHATPVIAAPGIRVPDVFTPDWSQLAGTHTAVACAAYLQSPQLIAWLPDEGLAWGDTGSGRPGLLQVCLSLEPTFAAYHAAWEFVLASHGGNLDALAVAWSTPLANKEVLRERTRADQAIATRGYSRDDQRWTREFAQRYFRQAAAAIRSVDANHLVATGGFALPPPPYVLAAAFPAVDLAWLSWLDLPAPGSMAEPIFASEVSPPDLLANAAAAARPLRAPRLTTIETLLRRARTALRRVARHPSVVGYAWGQWADLPGEVPPFSAGLVRADGEESLTNVELATEFNLRVEALRRSAAKQLTL
jgi:hypothetical protein